MTVLCRNCQKERHTSFYRSPVPVAHYSFNRLFPSLSSPVKKQIELKSRGVKLMPSKDNNQKTSVCKCWPARPAYQGTGLTLGSDLWCCDQM